MTLNLLAISPRSSAAAAILLRVFTSLSVTETLTPPIQLLKELVEINTGPAQSADVDRIQKRVRKELARPVRGRYGPSNKRFITLITHVDMVFEPSSGLVQTFSDHENTEVEFEIVFESPPCAVNSDARKVSDAYRQAIAKIEKRAIKAKDSGGSAHSNEFYRHGVVIIDGLGASGEGMHTREEFVRISSLETRAAALALFLENSSQLGDKVQ